MRIEATPKDSLVDESIAIRLSGFPPERSVKLRATTRDYKERKWESWIVLTPDANGGLDVGKQKPRSGTYHNADANGLLWSMLLDPTIRELTPFDTSSARPLLVEIVAEHDGQELARTEVIRRFAAADIVRTPVQSDGMVGTLFHRPDCACPGVVWLPGSGGGIPEADAALLASHGFAVLALAYFGMETLPPDLCEIPLEYFQRAIGWLRAQPSVLNDRLAVVGRSKGGELALLLGATFPDLKAVVAYVPSGVVWMGVGADPSCMLRSSWSHRGAPLPFVPLPSSGENPLSSPPVDTSRFYRAAMSNAAAMTAAEIPVEKTNGPILMISGLDDKCWPSADLSNIAVARLEHRQFKHFYEHVAYQGAGHLIEPCFRPTTVSEIFHPLIRMPMALGGNAAADAAADMDSWTKVLAFLQQRL